LDLAPFVPANSSAAPPLIVAVGRLIVKKGFADLVRACRLLMERGKSFRCAIIGEGPLEQELGAQINQLGLQDCVELPGAKPQHEIREYLVAASVFVLPSVVDPDGGMDNLPTVIMEAMAAGLPVVSTATGGIPEMVIQNETGFLGPPGDTVALAGAIERLFDDIGLARRLGERGFQRAEQLFSIEKNARELLATITNRERN
jgi:colanic acid/amylovoran biosynthesis glycosyltransferase